MDFKDRFFSGLHWKGNRAEGAGLVSGHQTGLTSRTEDDQTSQTASMHVDNILAGLKAEEVVKLDKEESKTGRMLKAKEDKYRGGLRAINEDIMERQSHSSMASAGIEDILTRGRDPRRGKNEPNGMNRIEEEKLGHQTSFLTHDDLKKFKMNEQFFRQNEAIIS